MTHLHYQLTHLGGGLCSADIGLEVADQSAQEVQQVWACDAACCHGDQPAEDLNDRRGDEGVHSMLCQVVEEGLQN